MQSNVRCKMKLCFVRVKLKIKRRGGLPGLQHKRNGKIQNLQKKELNSK